MWKPPADEKLLTAPAVAKALEVAKPTAERLIEAGILGTVYQGERSRMVASAEVNRFLDRPLRQLEDLPPALIVRPAPVARVEHDDDREWIGWHPQMPAEIADLALDRWWPVADREELKGKLLVAVLGPMPVRVRRIEEVEDQSENGRVAFNTSNPTASDQDAKVWRESRIAALPGGLTIRHKI